MRQRNITVLSICLIVLLAFLLLNQDRESYSHSTEVLYLLWVNRLLSLTFFVLVILSIRTVVILLRRIVQFQSKLMESAIAVGIFALFVLIGASSDFAGAYRGYQEGRKFTNSVLDGSNHFYVRYRDFVHTTADEHVMAEYEQETLARLCKAASVEENDCTPEWYLTSDIRREYLLQDYRDTVWRMLIIMPLAICYLLVMFYLYVDREKVGEREQSG